MSYFQYNLNDSSGSFVQIHYDISYDQVTNTSTVTFTNSWYRAFGDAEVKTSWDTDIVVTATDSNEKAESGIHFVQNIYSGRQFFDPIPTPQSVTVKHSNTSGVKTITIYSYTKRSARNTYKGSKTVTIETGEYTYGKALPPTSVTLNKDKATRDDNEVKLDWSGAIAGLNNPIKGYNVKYQLEEGGSIKDTRIITVESNNFVFTPQELIGAKKNQIITLSISAISTYGDGILDSDYSTTKSITIINKAPEKPTFSTSGYLRINDNVTIDNAATIIIKDLKSQDADGDTLTYHYQVANEFTENNGDYVWGVYNDNGEFVPNTTTIQLPQQKEIKMLLDEPVIRIRSYDGEAYSDWSDPWKVPANTEPFLKEIVSQVSSQNIATSINGERQYVKEFSSLTASIDKDGAKITYYLWEFNWGTSIESDILNESKIYNFIPGAADADYGGGKEIEVRLSVVDESGDEFTTEYQSLGYYRLETKKIEGFSVIPWRFGNEVNGTYLSENVYFKVNFNQLETDPQYKFNFYKLTKTANAMDNILPAAEDDLLKSATWTQDLIKSGVPAINGEINYGENINGEGSYDGYRAYLNDNGRYRFKVVVSDPFGQQVTSLETQTPQQLLRVFNIHEGTFEFDNLSNNEWHPMISNEAEVKFTTYYSDSDEDGTGYNYYTFVAKFSSGRSVIIAEKISASNPGNFTREEINGNTIDFFINKKELFKLLKSSSNSPIENVTFELIGYNALFRENPNTKTINFKMVTQEAPFFEKGTKFEASVFSNCKDVNKKNWFNPGDGVSFFIRKGEQPGQPFDYNDFKISADGSEEELKTISQYEIVYKEKNSTNAWKILKQPESFIGDDGEYLTNFYIESMPDLSNKSERTYNDLIFGIRLIDDTGLKTEDNKIITTELRACRKENPIFNIASAEKVGDTLYVNLSSEDLGGNALGSENFWRSQDEKYNVTLEISNSEDNISMVAEIPSNSNIASDFKNGVLTKTMPTPIPSKWDRVYITATITIYVNSTDSYNFVRTTTRTYLLYLNSPTMSHRYHWVGINTNDNDAKEVFKVAQYDKQNLIVLTGIDENDATIDNVITINLSNGLLTGMRKHNGVEGTNYTINLATGEMSGYTINNSTFTGTFNGQYNGYINIEQIKGEINGGSWDTPSQLLVSLENEILKDSKDSYLTYKI